MSEVISSMCASNPLVADARARGAACWRRRFAPFAVVAAQLHPSLGQAQAAPAWVPCELAEDELSFAGSRIDPDRLRCGRLDVLEDPWWPEMSKSWPLEMCGVLTNS